MKLHIKKKVGSKDLTKAQKERKKRLKRSLKPSSQSALYFTSLFENGLMHVKDNIYSRTYKLGDTAYTSANNEDKVVVMDTYAEALSGLDVGNNYQLLVINRKLAKSSLDEVLYKLEADEEDVYREEYNDLITDRFAKDSKNFQVDKYVTLSTMEIDQVQAETQLHELSTAIHDQFQEMEIAFDPIDGLERLKICHQLLEGNPYFPYTYKDIALSGLRAKDFITPSRIHFKENHLLIDKTPAKVMYIKHYPTFLTDKLIHLLTGVGIEMAITVHAEPYEPGDFATQLQTVESLVKMDMVESQINGAIEGVDSELAISGLAREITQTTARWKEEIHENDQKAFSGVMAVYFRAEDTKALKVATDNIKARGRRLGVQFSETYYYQKEGLNTILPIGQAFLNVKSDFIRPMTTSNIATQIPFTNVDLQSDSPDAIYYGQNQLSHNIITLDRKEDLDAANGVVLGSSGSGKGMTVKTTEIIPTLLKYPDDRIIIVDPEDEYSDIGRAFKGQTITIIPKSSTHLNLLDLLDTEEVLLNDNNEEIDPIADKANLLMGLFDSILKDLTDNHITIIDRVTREVYKRVEKPTLVDWQKLLKEQPEESAQELAVKAEIYTTGSLNLFAHETNVNLSSRLIVFNLKGLSKKLKPFALMVIQDYIWQQVIAYKGKQTIRLYWDELHLTFRTKTDASFFAELWARIRKYGSIPTGITQNIGVILAYEEGRNLLSNSEFMILLKQKPQDIVRLQEVIDIPDALIKYIKRPKAKGTGLIVAGSTIVPFENPIPKETKLYQLTQTDA
ncbi:DUF87 domain-containing protein [Streptococcus iniae]|nr:DUF87 domain-containing protein [Streptococcus iniae]